MFLESEFFSQRCPNEFVFNMGIMIAEFWHLTGMAVFRAAALRGASIYPK